LCRFTGKRVADLSNSDFEQLRKTIKEYSFIPASTAGYDKAEVTRGGVDTKDISSKTMESKLLPGLFFIGEVLDVTGLLGGYNFQWAWSSGWVAGENL
jgi:predicted flavoprotein YhiN